MGLCESPVEASILTAFLFPCSVRGVFGEWLMLFLILLWVADYQHQHPFVFARIPEMQMMLCGSWMATAAG